MRSKQIRIVPFMSLLSIILPTLYLTACMNPSSHTAAGEVAGGATANPALVGTVQADQYWRDAQATTTAQQATLAANYRHIEATAQSGTATAIWQITAQAISLQATQQSIAATGTVQAIELAALARAATAEVEETALAQAATTAAQATTATFQATRQAFEIAQAEAQAQREKVVTLVTTILAFSGVTLLLALLIWFLWQVIPTLAARMGMVRYGQHGNPLLLLQRNGKTVLTDPLALFQAAATINQNAEVKMPTLAPNEIQTLISASRLRLLTEQARHAPGHPLQLAAETTTQRRLGNWESNKTIRHAPTQSTGEGDSHPTQLNNNTPEIPLLPSGVTWQQLTQWRGPGFALGAGSQQNIITLNLAQTPHLFTAGMSGSGKTRRLLRPLVAQALATGYSIILMNESGADFSPFYNQPNVHIIRGEISNYKSIFKAALEELAWREAQLRTAQISEWRRLSPMQRQSHPLTLLVIDELLALALLLSPKEQREWWGLLAAFASRARKVGMCSLGLATDPTYRALGQGGLNYRSQCGRISFRMMQAASSRAVLDAGGAETLQAGQFMALLDQPGVMWGMSANPSDAELTAYLTRNPVQALPPPTWLSPLLSAARQPLQPAPTGTTTPNQLQPVAAVAANATTHAQTPQPPAQPQLPLDTLRSPTAVERAYMRRLYVDGLSKNGVCRAVYGFKDGKRYAWVSAALEEGESTEERNE